MPESRQTRRWLERRTAKKARRQRLKAEILAALDVDRAAFPRPRAAPSRKLDRVDVALHRNALAERIPDKFLSSHARALRALAEAQTFLRQKRGQTVA